MEQFIHQNLIWVMTCVFGAGGLWILVKQMGKRLDQHELKIEAKFDSLTQRDLQHDARLAALERDHAALDAKVNGLSGWMKELRDAISGIGSKVDGIYKELIEQGRAK